MTTAPSAAQASPAASATPALKWVAALAIGLLALLFAALTRAAWEDYYITFRSSQNLVDGHGLVYNPGERVHTFTSPLGVLLPALAYAITGSATGALWLFRILSAAFLGAAAWLAAGALAEQGWKRAATVTALALGLAQIKTIEFAANGMETGMLVFFTVLAFRELVRPEGPRRGTLACAYAGLMWTRPDAFVIAGGLTLGAWLFSREKRGPLLRAAAPAIGLGVLLYLPWLLGAWWYYGSPVPQTIVAKTALSPAQDFDALRLLFSPLRALTDYSALTETFAPTYHQGQNWGRNWEAIWAFFARLACFLWVWPALPRAARVGSFALFMGALYLQQILPYPWYYSPWTLLGGIALAGLLARGWRVSAPAARVLLSAALTSSAFLLVAGTLTARARQRLVEEAVRKPAGLWLKAHARPGDTVFLEPIGYIGYFSAPQVRLLDFPGLTAPAVSAAIREVSKDYAPLIARLEPDWIVLRPLEISGNQKLQNEILPGYRLRARFDNREAIQNAALAPGRQVLLYDAEFLIFERRRPPSAAEPGEAR